MSKGTIKLNVFIICCILISMGRLLLCKGQVFAQGIEPEGSYALYAEDGLGSMCPFQARLEGSYVLYAEDGLKTWQGNIAEAMKALNNNPYGIWYPANGAPYLDSGYWTGTFQSGWTPNANKEPSAAIEWYFSNLKGTGYSTDCLMAAQACVYKGLLDTVGKTAFNEWFRNHRSDLGLGLISLPLIVTKSISSENDLIKGDWVYFQNFVDGESCPAINPLQGENAIVQTSNGIRTYIGLGIPARGEEPVTSQEICEHLGFAYLDLLASMRGTENLDYYLGCIPTRDLMIAKALVLTASPAYFANFNRSSPPVTTSTKPLAPGNLRAAAVSSSRINITWTDNSNNETGFKIYRANFTTQKWDLINTVSANSTSCYNDNLSPGTTYYYTVGAYNEAGTNAPTGSDGKTLSVSATTSSVTTSTKPLAPGNLRATAVSGRCINITWTDNSNNETGFKIYRANFTTQKWDLINTVSANSTSCYDDNLSSGTTYYYTVGAYNEAGTNAPTGSDGKILSVSATTY